MLQIYISVLYQSLCWSERSELIHRNTLVIIIFSGGGCPNEHQNVSKTVEDMRYGQGILVRLLAFKIKLHS